MSDGIGKIYKRKYKDNGIERESPFWWVQYPHGDETRREAVKPKTTDERTARAFLKRRLEEIGRGSFAPGQDRVYLKDLVDLLQAEHRRKNNKGPWEDVLLKLKAPLEFFAPWPVPEITVKTINAFKDFRLKELAIASVNGELRYVRRLLNLGLEQRVIAIAPKIKEIEGGNKREDYIEAGDFYARLDRIQDQDVRDLVEFLFLTGWRKRSAMRLERADVDFERETVKLRANNSKNKKEKVLPFAKFSTLRDILLRRWAKLRPDCVFVFHRNGKQIKEFRRLFKRAFEGTGLKIHGLCRSAAVAMDGAGIHERVASDRMNRTEGMYRRYNIKGLKHMEEAGEAFQNYLEVQREKKKVIDIGAGKKGGV